MRLSRAPFVLALLLSGCVAHDRVDRTEIWYRRPTIARASTTGRTEAPRDQWPATAQSYERLKPALAGGLLTKEGALQTVREASDPESAIATLEARRFAFRLDEPTLAWFADNGVPQEVFDYLAKRSKVDWDSLHDSSDADRASDYGRDTIEVPEPAIVQTWDAPPPPPPCGTTIVEVWPSRWYYSDGWRYRRGWCEPTCRPTTQVYVGGYVGTPNYRGVVNPNGQVRVLTPARPIAGLYAPPPPPPAPRPIYRGSVGPRR